MTLKWYGNSCFLLTAADGTRILTDPCDPSTGYPAVHDIEADIVTVSHAHFDHNYTAAVVGNPTVVSALGETVIGNVKLTGLASWHDEEKGALRGPNTVYIIEVDGLRVAHLGDLGHMPDEALLKAIGNVDVLLIPVGGTFTIGAKQAAELVELLKPTVTVPMHFKTPVLSFEIAGVDPFLQEMKAYKRHRLLQEECTLTPGSLGGERVLVLDYAKE